MDRQKIILNFTEPPSLDDVEVLAKEVFITLPEEILDLCTDLTISVEDLPDEMIETEYELEDPYELLAFFRSGKEISPGVLKKEADSEDNLTIFRRPVLDLWCESCDQLAEILREIMISELGRQFEFSDDEIDEFAGRHHQGLL